MKESVSRGEGTFVNGIYVIRECSGTEVGSKTKGSRLTDK